MTIYKNNKPIIYLVGLILKHNIMEKIKQILEQINELQNSILKLKEELHEAKKIEIQKHHIKVGDKVEVETWRGKTICFVDSVDIHNNLTFDYDFTKPKKDGTKSRIAAGIYSYKSIKKL